MRHPLLLLIVFAGCSKLLDLEDVTYEAGPPRELVAFPVTASRDLDLLFLIDDSPLIAMSMTDKLANLAGSFPGFISTLQSFPGGLPNLHIGFATSDMGTQGALDTNPSFGPAVDLGHYGACSGVGKNGVLQVFRAPVTGVFLSDSADPMTGIRTRNYTGNLADVMADIVKGAGAVGCGFEQPLAAIERALTNPANHGFLRPDAYLGVIVITDEDDCSLAHYSLLATDATSHAQLGELQSFRCTRFGVQCDGGGQTPDEMNQVGAKQDCHPDDGSSYLAAVGGYAAFLKSRKTFPGKVFVAGITGPSDPVEVELRPPPGGTIAIPSLAHSCSYQDSTGATAVADPAIRIQSFLDQFADHSAFASICDPDLSSALQQIGLLANTVMGPACFAGPLADADPEAAGAQYDCRVAVIDGQDPTPGRSLPACDRDDASATHQPCWHIAINAASCPKGDHLTPVIEGQDLLATDAYVTAGCVIASPAAARRR